METYAKVLMIALMTVMTVFIAAMTGFACVALYRWIKTGSLFD